MDFRTEAEKLLGPKPTELSQEAHDLKLALIESALRRAYQAGQATAAAAPKLTEEDESLIDMLLHYNDAFLTSYCGYWAYGYHRGTVESAGRDAWLVYVDPYDASPPKDEQEIGEAMGAFLAEQKLPENWYCWDRAFAEKVIAAGKGKYGEDFSSDYDAVTLDVAVQLVLFGEVTFG